MNSKSLDHKINICLWCGHPSQIIWVHGHGQCSVCGYNVDECCRGEVCDQSNLDIEDKKDKE